MFVACLVLMRVGFCLVMLWYVRCACCLLLCLCCFVLVCDVVVMDVCQFCVGVMMRVLLCCCVCVCLLW